MPHVPTLSLYIYVAESSLTTAVIFPHQLKNPPAFRYSHFIY